MVLQRLQTRAEIPLPAFKAVRSRGPVRLASPSHGDSHALHTLGEFSLVLPPPFLHSGYCIGMTLLLSLTLTGRTLPTVQACLDATANGFPRLHPDKLMALVCSGVSYA